MQDTQLGREGLVLTRPELLKSHIHFLKALLFIDQVVFLVLAQLQIVHILDEVLQGLSLLAEGGFDLFKGVVNVFSLLVGKIEQVTSDVRLLLLYFTTQGVSQTFTHNVDETLLVLSTNVGCNDLIPIGKAIKPCFD